MRLTIVDERHIRLETAPPRASTPDGARGSQGAYMGHGEHSGTPGHGGLEIAGGQFGPLQMLAASLALCTISVVLAYGDTAGLEMAGFALDLRWEYAEEPYRVGAYDLTLELPQTVPATRHRAVLRAADTCTVHNTLAHPPRVSATIAAPAGGRLAA